MEYIVRPMKKEDIQQVQQVARASWNDTYKGIIPLKIQENFLNYAYNTEMMQKRLEHSQMLVSEYKDIIVGFANFSTIGQGSVELSAIYLLPEYQGKGIGTALLNKGIDNFDRVKEIYVNVEKENKIGTSFYEAKGFQIVKEFDDDFDGHILKTIRMVLKV